MKNIVRQALVVAAVFGLVCAGRAGGSLPKAGCAADDVVAMAKDGTRFDGPRYLAAIKDGFVDRLTA